MPTGRTVRLAGTTVHNGVLLRLAEMGMTAGALVAVTRRAPLGDPIEIEVRGTRVCLRKKDAACFDVVRPDDGGEA